MSKGFLVRFQEDEYDRLRALSSSTGITITGLIRGAVRNLFNGTNGSLVMSGQIASGCCVLVVGRG